ncbi:Ser/Thr protein kinase RdoA involved in Cpx stress response, MazF antagonist [Paenibacillus sophorae]|uniref:Phosphotransferase n=1 Tax=Paenibacillus sophorae TaxID=1333845 RepID=A0A1H8FIG3_9BACL|nr:phosphotransferase [Paenibacillus sophorae]QWU13879.1 phosphotransferase [Paenibacillus sophorae]SEN31425.1 Ser/Thr protein kinase RdoA involved in Cpx stress response, MazF antagonist [Paenibacillus sophorae]
MEQAIVDIFNSNHAERAAAKYGITGKHLTFIGGFQNFVYEYLQGDKPCILRLTPSTHRSAQTVQAELEWILYLADHGISVSSPIVSKSGNLTEVVGTDTELFFTAVAFEKAPGHKASYPECLNDEGLYEKLGQLTGKMHALSQSYRPRNESVKRQDWSGNYYLKNIDILPASHTLVRQQYLDLAQAIHRLPKESHTYGLIHGDMGVGNYTVDNRGAITLYDFDEAQYSWYVEDIAVQLYYLVYVYGGEEGYKLREEQAHRFMKPFLKGYHLENELDESMLKQIPLFLQLRELIVYIGAFRNFAGDETFSGSDNQWFKDWIAESRIRLESGTPIVDIW